MPFGRPRGVESPWDEEPARHAVRELLVVPRRSVRLAGPLVLQRLARVLHVRPRRGRPCAKTETLKQHQALPGLEATAFYMNFQISREHNLSKRSSAPGRFRDLESTERGTLTRTSLSYTKPERPKTL